MDVGEVWQLEFRKMQKGFFFSKITICMLAKFMKHDTFIQMVIFKQIFHFCIFRLNFNCHTSPTSMPNFCIGSRAWTDPWPCLFNRSPDLDPAKTDPDPDFAGSGSGKTGSRSGYCRIWVRQNRIQIRIRPDLDPANPDPDPEFSGSGSGKTGSRSGICRIQIR